MKRLLCILLALLAGGCAMRPTAVGVDANYALDMLRRGKTFHDAAGNPADPFELLAQNGATTIRVRLWVGDEGMNQLDYAVETAARAHRAGLEPYVVIFLSEEWADYVKQPAPDAWKGLTPRAKAKAIQTYTRRVARRFADEQIPVKYWAIGNEIDYGICGEFEERWSHRVSTDYMRETVWPRILPLLIAGQAGVKQIDRDAQFIVHLTQWNNTDYCIAMWRAMIAGGVQVDYAGLSYFPSSAENPGHRPLAFLAGRVKAVARAIDRPVILCETAYPSQPEFGGQFATWNKPVPGCPLTEQGQARWLAELVAAARDDEHIAGVYYWSPEWYDSELWHAFALFGADGQPRPALSALATPGD